MTKIYTANQPLFFPSIYMMNRYLHSEVLVIMEEAQFTKFGHQSRVEIMTHAGKKYLTVPLKDRDFKHINEVALHNPEKTIRVIQNTLQGAYGSRTAFRALRKGLWDALTAASLEKTLSGFNSVLLSWVWEVMDMKTEVVRSLDVLPNRPIHPSEWVAEMGRAVGGTVYLGGGTAQHAYIRPDDFTRRGIALRPQQFRLPEYKSVMGQELGPHNSDGWVSILDPLLFHGQAFAKELISGPAWGEQ